MNEIRGLCRWKGEGRSVSNPPSVTKSVDSCSDVASHGLCCQKRNKFITTPIPPPPPCPDGNSSQRPQISNHRIERWVLCTQPQVWFYNQTKSASKWQKKKLLRNEGVTSCREIAMPILTGKVNLIECRWLNYHVIKTLWQKDINNIPHVKKQTNKQTTKTKCLTLA